MKEITQGNKALKGNTMLKERKHSMKHTTQANIALKER